VFGDFVAELIEAEITTAAGDGCEQVECGGVVVEVHVNTLRGHQRTPQYSR